MTIFTVIFLVTQAWQPGSTVSILLSLLTVHSLNVKQEGCNLVLQKRSAERHERWPAGQFRDCCGFALRMPRMSGRANSWPCLEETAQVPAGEGQSQERVEKF